MPLTCKTDRRDTGLRTEQGGLLASPNGLDPWALYMQCSCFCYIQRV
ncbi:hypothetical protein [Desulfotruncus arcticus]|nr:hypothetical protein [Desulfotruncus arcticus]